MVKRQTQIPNHQGTRESHPFAQPRLRIRCKVQTNGVTDYGFQGTKVPNEYGFLSFSAVDNGHIKAFIETRVVTME